MRKTIKIKETTKKSQDWNPALFKNFLNLMITGKADCQFKEATVDSLKTTLCNTCSELVEKNTSESVTILRTIDEYPTIFQIKIEKTNPTRRFSLNLFSIGFRNDGESELGNKKKWKDTLPQIKYTNEKIKETISALLKTDFLQEHFPDYKTSRVCCYHVSFNENYSETLILYKFLKISNIEFTEIFQEGSGKINKNKLDDLHKKYLRQANEFLIKDAAVAKAQQGFSYQEYLIMLLSYIAMKHEEVNFNIIAEAKLPEAWNDIFMQCNEEILFFQQKHRSSYSSSVKKSYSVKEILAPNGKEDCSIFKYFLAYREVKELINNPENRLHYFKNKLSQNKAKFIFFTNREFPITKRENLFFLEDHTNIKLSTIEPEKIPLLNSFPECNDIINRGSIFKFESFDVTLLGLNETDQDEFNEFLEKFYLFLNQKDANALFQTCKTIIKTPLGGAFGQGTLVDTFSHYIHQWFIAEDPEYHVINYSIIKSFFDNHEQYYYNLVKYSSFDSFPHQLNKLSSKNLDLIKNLSCVKNISSRLHEHRNIILTAQDPFTALIIVQSLFPAGKRQIFTPFMKDIDYIISNKTDYFIAVGTDDKLFEIVKKLKFHIKTKGGFLIQIVFSSLQNNDSDISLDLLLNEVNFLKKDYPLLSIFNDYERFCLTDLLHLSLSNLPEALSKSEKSVYLPQDLSDETVTLPLLKLETEIKEYFEDNSKNFEPFWTYDSETVKNTLTVAITLPSYLQNKKIEMPANSSFILKEEENILLYKIIEDVSDLEDEDEDEDEDKDEDEEPKPYLIKWENLYSDKKISIVEAEAGCGKTWYLRSKINPEQIYKIKKIPIFIRIKDITRIENTKPSIVDLINIATFPSYLRRMIIEKPQYFDLLLDGFDELSKEFEPVFKFILADALEKGYSITITVRDYQKKNLFDQTNSIIIEQRLNRFDEAQINICLKKHLDAFILEKGKETDAEINKLTIWLTNTEQSKISAWLGIPFHIALISDWYKHNYTNFSTQRFPKIAEIYNFIIQMCLEKCANKNRDTLYKMLYKIAFCQIFVKNVDAVPLTLKKHHFKTDLIFDLQRSGLLREPYSKHPDLFHRTFAEFLVSKKLWRKAASDSCKNEEFNSKLIALLYHSKYALINHFFNELFLIAENDSDNPYQLKSKSKTSFEKRWLYDIFAQPLSNKQESPIIWESNMPLESADEDSTKTEYISEYNIGRIKLDLENPYSFNEIRNIHHTPYLINCFALYDATKNDKDRKILHNLICEINFRLFLREDYPPKKSIFSQLKYLDALDIASVKVYYTWLEKISAQYNWWHNRNSHAFKCWSHGGHHDRKFAFIILTHIGSHLNIIHVFYIRLYVTYGGYDFGDKSCLLEIAMKHHNSIRNEENPRVVFCSILLFLGLIDDWKSTQNTPKLPQIYINRILHFFEFLLTHDNLTQEAKLFVKILLVDFVMYFNMGMHLSHDTTLLIFSDGTSKKLNICRNQDEIHTLKIIFQRLLNKKNEEDFNAEKRFNYFFQVWDELKPSRKHEINSDSEMELDQGSSSESEMEIDLPSSSSFTPQFSSSKASQKEEEHNSFQHNPQRWR